VIKPLNDYNETIMMERRALEGCPQEKLGVGGV